MSDLPELEHLRLAPGETLVLRSRTPLDEWVFIEFHEWLPDHLRGRVLLFDSNFEMAVVPAEEAS